MKFNRLDYQDVILKYNDEAMDYCLNVLEGRLLAGKLIKLACLRHLKDLQKIGNKDFKYDYSVKKAKGMINFAEIIPDVSSGECLPLASFQKFIYSMIAGWIDPSINGSRFKTTLLSMARTNGKTQLASCIALREFLIGQPVNSRQVALVSNTTDQVKQLYNYVRKAWHALSITKYFKPFADGVVDNSQEMRIEETNTFLRKFSSEGTTGDSVHASTTIFDEFHRQKTREYLNTFTSGNVQNPLARTIIISTAGTVPTVPMYMDYQTYSEKLEKGTLDDSILFLDWEQDNDDEVFKPETWIKSNPLMEIPKLRKVLTTNMKIERDKQIEAGTLPEFLVKNMNRWQNAKKNAYISLANINKSVIPEFDMHGRDVYLGYDTSLSNDDTSLVAVFPYLDSQNNQRFHIWQHSFIPTKVAGGIEAKEKLDSINYREAERQGFCTITTNRFGTIDQEQVFSYFMNLVEKYQWNVLAFGYDAWGTGAFIRSLEELKDKWLLFPIRQGSRSLSEPTKYVQDHFESGMFTIFDDEVLKAGLSNAVLTSKDNLLLIDKNIGSQKIDMVDALIDAMYQGMLHFTSFSNADEKKDNSPFAGMSNEEINDHFKNKFSF